MANFLSRYFYKRRKRKHYQSRIKVAEMKLWDYEWLFKQKKDIREAIRIQYDQVKERLDAATLRLEEENKKENPDKIICENLEKVINEKFNPQIKQFKKQMEDLDQEIKQSGGVNDAIEGSHILLEDLKKHKKSV